MSTTNNQAAVVAFRNPVQALIFDEVIVPNLTKGHWKDAYPLQHAKDWADAEVIVDEKSVGVAFEPAKTNYDLLNKGFVDSVGEKALKRIKSKLGHDMTMRDFRAQLKDMMFIMRTPKGKPLATSHQGMMGRPGRPSRTDLEGLLAKSRAAVGKEDLKDRQRANAAKVRTAKAAKKTGQRAAA